MPAYQFRVWWNQQSHLRFVSLQRNACSITSTFWVDSCNSRYTLGPKPANNPWSLTINFTPVDGDTLSVQTSGSSSPFNQFAQIRENNVVIGSASSSIQRTTPLVYFRWHGAWHEFRERSYTELEDWIESIRNPNLPHTEPIQIPLVVPPRNALPLKMPEHQKQVVLDTNSAARNITLDVPSRDRQLALMVLSQKYEGIT